MVPLISYLAHDLNAIRLKSSSSKLSKYLKRKKSGSLIVHILFFPPYHSTDLGMNAQMHPFMAEFIALTCFFLYKKTFSTSEDSLLHKVTFHVLFPDRREGVAAAGRCKIKKPFKNDDERSLLK